MTQVASLLKQHLNKIINFSSTHTLKLSAILIRPIQNPWPSLKMKLEWNPAVVYNIPDTWSLALVGEGS